MSFWWRRCRHPGPRRSGADIGRTDIDLSHQVGLPVAQIDIRRLVDAGDGGIVQTSSCRSRKRFAFEIDRADRRLEVRDESHPLHTVVARKRVGHCLRKNSGAGVRQVLIEETGFPALEIEMPPR